MRLLPEPDLYKLLRQLTREQSNVFLNALTSSLTTISSESSTPEHERLIHQPLRSHIVTKDKNLSLFMPVSNTTTTGIKIVTAPASSGAIVGVINIFSPQGKLLGLLSAEEVTAFRTALAIMTLFVRCGGLKKEHIVIFGSGRQAEWHARLALLLIPEGEIKKITFINRGRKRLEKMEKEVIADLRAKYPGLAAEILAKEGTDASDYDDRLKAELASSDVIFSCTPSTEPNFPYSYLLQPQKKQRFISLIGSYKPYMKEIDTDTLLSGEGKKVYVDSKEACLEESGELIDAQVKEDQLIEIGELFGRLGESGAVDVPEGCNVVFKCVGMGIMDLVVGKMLLDLACEVGVGMDVDGF